jgi:hypothetical protein
MMSPGHIVFDDVERAVSRSRRFSWIPAIPRARCGAGQQQVDDLRVVHERGARRRDPGHVRRLEQPVDRQFRVPLLVHLHRVEAESDQQVGGLERVNHQPVGGHAADHADEIGGGLVNDALDLRGDGDGQVPAGEPRANPRCVGGVDAEAEQDQRALRLFEAAAQVGGGRVRVRRRRSHPPGRRACIRRRRRLHRFARRHRQVGGAVRPLHARRQRARHHLAGVGAGDLVHEAAHRPIGVVEREQLMGVARRKLVRDLRRDRQQRLLIQVGARQRQHQVGGAGPEGRQHHAGLAAELAVDGRRDAGVGFVPHQHEIDAGAAQLVDQHQDFPAGQPEHTRDARVGQSLRHRRRRRCHVGEIICDLRVLRGA